MFEELYAKKHAIQRQRNGLFAQERERYLRHCLQTGSTRITLRVKGQALLRFVNHMQPTDQDGVSIGRYEEIVASVTALHPTAGAIYSVKKYTRPWLQYLGWWLEPKPVKYSSCELDDFVRWMRDERGLSQSTIEQWTERVRTFLAWFAKREKAFKAIDIHDVDKYFLENEGRWGRSSSAYMVTMLRVFLRHAGSVGHCDRRLPDLIDRPRIYELEGLPSALDWSDVKRLLSDANTENGRDVRDLACMMLMSIYGLRRSEVAALRIEHIDFVQSRLMIQRAKNRVPQIYPLVPSMADALSQYIHNWRPAVQHSEIFIRSTAPLVPISPSGLSTTVHRRIKQLELRTSVARSGPHALRHACAVKLLSDGLTLKEIGDHLGHKSTAATRVYAKTDMHALREVAEFDLGDLS